VVALNSLSEAPAGILDGGEGMQGSSGAGVSVCGCVCGGLLSVALCVVQESCGERGTCDRLRLRATTPTTHSSANAMLTRAADIRSFGPHRGFLRMCHEQKRTVVS
jgi:hypothetical protein